MIENGGIGWKSSISNNGFENSEYEEGVLSIGEELIEAVHRLKKKKICFEKIKREILPFIEIKPKNNGKFCQYNLHLFFSEDSGEAYRNGLIKNDISCESEWLFSPINYISFPLAVELKPKKYGLITIKDSVKGGCRRDCHGFVYYIKNAKGYKILNGSWFYSIPAGVNINNIEEKQIHKSHLVIYVVKVDFNSDTIPTIQE